MSVKFAVSLITLAVEECRGKTNGSDCATCSRDWMLYIPASQKCNFGRLELCLVDKGIGAIWPNSSVRNRMKLFAGKINPLPSLSTPVFASFGFIGIACVMQPSVFLTLRRSQLVLACKTHMEEHALRKTHRSVSAKELIY